MFVRGSPDCITSVTCSFCEKARRHSRLKVRKRLLCVTPVSSSCHCFCAATEISSRNPMMHCPQVDGFPTTSLLHRTGVDRVSSPLSLSCHLAVSSPALFRTLQPHPAARTQVVALRPHPPSFHRTLAITTHAGLLFYIRIQKGEVQSAQMSL
jgi:hypothetical protein